METLNNASLLTQRSLWGAITPELRAVSIDLDNDNKKFFIYYYYDGEVSEKIIDLWQCATTEASAGLEFFYYDVEKIERLDFPSEIPDKGVIIYYRKESKILANIKKTFELIKCNYTEDCFSIRIRCVMQKAILGYITPNIRKIALEWWYDLIYVHFYYDSEIEKEDHENMYQVCKNLFNEVPHCCIKLLYFTIKEPIVLPHHKETIYFRYEEILGVEALFSPLEKNRIPKQT